MVRSLYTGISGLRTHQVGMDVTANNISNVNTVAFKAGRATFKESMVQMLQGPSRPAGNQGGRNPLQIGLGVAVGSIDTMLRQGNMQTTGQITDIALEGRAYLAFSNGTGTYYSRNGGLQLDDQGRLTSPTNGFRLQGKMAQPDGTFTGKEMISDIRIPWGEKSPAKATENVKFGCNLNSDSEALGTVTHTSRFLASAATLLAGGVGGRVGPAMYDSASGASRAKLTDLFDEYGNSLGIKEGDTITIATGDNGVPMFSFKVEKYPLTTTSGTPAVTTPVLDANGNQVMQIPTLQDFMDQLEGYLNAITDPTLGPQLNGTSTPVLEQSAKRLELSNYMRSYVPTSKGGTHPVTVSINPATGGLLVNNNSTPPAGGAINGLQVTSSRPGSKSYVANTFLFPSTIDYRGNPIYTATNPYTPTPTPKILIPASAMEEPTAASHPNLTVGERAALWAAYNDYLGDLYDTVGRPLGFTNGDQVNINGQVGSRNKNDSFEYREIRPTGGGDIQPGSTTMQDLLDWLQRTLSLPSNDGTVYKRPSVAVKNSSDLVSDGIPPGSIVLRGQQEVAFALTGLSVLGKQADPNQPNAPTRFNTNMVFTEVQAARKTGEKSTATVVYDDSGAEHQLTMTFTHTGTPGEWLWELELVGGEEIILGGNRGKLTFGVDGTPASFTFDDGTNQFRFDPRNGASEVNIAIDYGAPGSNLGITQYKSESTTAFKDQDGYPMGKLTEITIGESGEISGLYSNGISKAIAQIYVAEFNNPAGLLKMGDSMFGVSNNSGEAAMYQPGVGSTTKIKPGAIEMSNVELETEFTNMITQQRGYQACARVITTSDQMLQELVQLVR
ncbi:MAG: flagellar hook-basal body complex protein [Chitinispirillales bacterium]|jgi:flagellar hook protein FlgE|nr:flagellar hook-basal body complex protein [Chitinispirillales bacterium]